MVVGDDHRQTQLAGAGDRGHRRNTVVDGENNAHPVGIAVFDNAAVDAVALGHAAGDNVAHLAAQRPQRPQQQGRAGHAVGVVVAADGDRLLSINSRHQQL